MKIVHSGFDSIYFAVRGALMPATLQRFEKLKEQALKDERDVSFSTLNTPTSYLLKASGKKGGYTYLISTGLAGSSIAFKASLSREEYNGFVEISSACLLAHRWKKSIARALDHVQALGFHVVEISLNRVDYCIDFLDAEIELDARDFIAHSRVKKSSYHDPMSAGEHVEKRSVAQADHVQSVTLGKMPGRQVIVYNKRAEVIERRKFYLFDVWGIDRRDATHTVHRVEVRAGKKHLLKMGIRTLADFERHIGVVLTDAVQVIRWVQLAATDTNVTRAPLHPVWEAVQAHMVYALDPYMAPLTEEAITNRMRENKQLEYRQQIAGNLGGWLAVSGLTMEDAEECSKHLIEDICTSVSRDGAPTLQKSFTRAGAKWS